jgi:hypothetical protein
MSPVRWVNRLAVIVHVDPERSGCTRDVQFPVDDRWHAFELKEFRINANLEEFVPDVLRCPSDIVKVSGAVRIA